MINLEKVMQDCVVKYNAKKKATGHLMHEPVKEMPSDQIKVLAEVLIAEINKELELLNPTMS